MANSSKTTPTVNADGPACQSNPQTTVAALCAGDFHDRWDQLRQVADLGESALGALLAILQDEEQDWESRWFAARALGDLPHPAVMPALIATFAATDDNDLRQAVAAALTQIGPAAIAVLGQRLAQDGDRPIVVQALARIQHPDTLPLLLGVIDDRRSTVRTAVMEALSAFADPATLPAIQQGLGDPVPAVRSAAIRGLLNLRSHLPPAHVIGELVPLLNDLDRGVAQQAAYALGRLPLPTATEALRQRLQTPGTPESLQICLVQALTWHNTNVALDGLIQAWDGLGEPVRLTLVQGLAALTPALRPQATAALVDWLHALPSNSSQGLLRCHLVLALGQIGTTALEPELCALLNDPDPGVQLHAEAALRQMQA